MKRRLVSALCLVLMACSENKQHSPAPLSQQIISKPENVNDLPSTQLIHGWSKDKVQALQRETAKAIGISKGISFHDNLTIDGVLFSAPKLIVIPPAVFVMGCYEGDKSCFPREDVKALITIDYPFAVSEREVSNADWALCVDAGGYCEPKSLNSAISDKVDFAVTSISWSEAITYTSWLSKTTGKKYRLLSEAEFEHASRAGGTGELLGNVIDCSSPKYQTVKSNDCYFNPKERNRNQASEQQTPNAFGLKNMHRGRWEWVQDCWHNSIFDNTPLDGSPYKEKDGCKSGLYVARGGDMGGIHMILRSSSRHIGRENKRFADVSFRVVREIE